MKVLLVVDMINDFIHENGSLTLGDIAPKLVEEVGKRIEFARENGYHIVYLRDFHLENDLEFRRFPTHAVRYTWGAEVVDKLKPNLETDDVLAKTRFSGFYETNLDNLLEAIGDIDEVELAGCCTSICIAQTAADLANRNHNVTIYRDAVADFNQEAHEFFLNYQLPNIFGVTIK